MKALAGALLLASAAFAQTPLPVGRGPQQDAYHLWHETDPNLERDATSAGATLGARADKVAAEAAKYFSLRKEYLESRAADARQRATLVQPVSVAPDALPSLDRYLGMQDTILRSSIDTIARDSDRAIQQLRASLERERAAIAAIGTAVKDSQKSQEAVSQNGQAAEQMRGKVSEGYQKFALALGESEELEGKSSTAWADYYRALSDAARAPVVPVTSSSLALPSAGQGLGAVEPGTPAASNPAPPPLRYAGAWTYPTVGAHFHGPQPESADLVVREENGEASGSLSARFRRPPGNATDPVVRFNFVGAFGNSRTQSFSITTTSGAKGTLELIPGPAVNMLEVNFTTDDKPGTVRQGNFLLIKQ